MDDLDTSWFDTQEDIESKYNIYYNTKVEQVKITLIYLGITKTIGHVKTYTLPLLNGILDRTVILNLLQTNKYHNKIKYITSSLFKYNASYSPDNVIHDNLHDICLHEISHIEDISFQDTIECFKLLNEVYIILQPQTNKNRTNGKAPRTQKGTKSNRYR